MANPPRAARQFNKVAVRLAGHRLFPLWAVLRHRGRKSGRDYATPVAVTAIDAGFLIALPWGKTTDWVRNVRAAGGCTIRWKGVEYVCSDPRFVDSASAIAATKGLRRRLLRRFDPPEGFLELTRERASATR